MVQELGLAIGIATLGSLASTVYRLRITAQLPSGLPPDVQGVVADSLTGAISEAHALPTGLLEQARDAFVTGFAAASSICAIAILLLTLLTAAMRQKE
ncbi:hypothetical protein A9404_12540 [Halothiobacillus diazotrophicus]|uniref:Uncharacterized protein n=2 Tax=Halothiobacillus diazotrophicus TaxID=1860122 RepID=A0A191ZJP5_9GAMM|nr:hypothetical protein A9404_12540 [Halothiobacillus diazotrophicus]